ncbi:hypothetical protein C0995_002319 [Termitomyces sp. Mi166|nr:hypothetical protein C0995_002319 [Termitomyces sp. Mi166\
MSENRDQNTFSGDEKELKKTSRVLQPILVPIKDDLDDTLANCIANELGDKCNDKGDVEWGDLHFADMLGNQLNDGGRLVVAMECGQGVAGLAAMFTKISLLKISAGASILECKIAMQDFVIATDNIFHKVQGLVMIVPLYKTVSGLLEGLLVVPSSVSMTLVLTSASVALSSKHVPSAPYVVAVEAVSSPPILMTKNW